ncbi:YjjG family noncanonical pyrimidine nucleotidase [Lentilactobacillus kefiri]|uniref:HAD superfamily hydrolase n=2 Tax=Lentilactobacillus kefiri TaxID=33962 RepID=A0A8E1RHY4_LENKE|nr:YjjG family noncanonical pyrimidine nucleotidase [Lentilactobacillus kefiri]KRL73686.1 HAD superfamily hydrolase [Lentilactobacillus parakefiri DSM 10551]KRM49790.1 HAD superfamily hydrolase [Lentilactobacillus kefiri DSM 20587 = JCM 5818]MCJ2161568.1 YjjG family noncanonical pyrimidine nucleotidase [Lentilactobacillus kefiri]MCP9368157.1 YjjG family noncanonical pyrimidine nucleotidase [Lentilactobacillus kefiri]MDH5108223.1 YjjG family noncanonical pyrimidine nucleotidase [Lentilactobacil
MKYSTLLFDVDDTLLNFQASEKHAITKLFNTIGEELTPTIYEDYHELNEHLWQQYELGKITRSQLLGTRFSLFFGKYGKHVDGQAYEKAYRSYLAEGHTKMPHAQELLADLSTNHDIYVVTNGIAKTQRRRLNESGLAPYFTHVFASEAVGYQKPDPAFFDYVAKKITGFSKPSSLVIGDSLTSDIKGAAAYGLDSVWFNPQHQANPTKTSPTYEIDQLLRLESIVA